MGSSWIKHLQLFVKSGGIRDGEKIEKITINRN
jgi:hypothetical protein